MHACPTGDDDLCFGGEPLGTLTFYVRASLPGINRNIWPLAVVVVAGAIMSILDTTIVNVAIETLSVDLKSPISSVQWVVTGYMLASPR